MANTVRVAAQVTGVGKASSELDRLKDKFEKLQKGGAKGFAIGAGAAITAGAFGLLAGAASRAVDVMGDAVEGALNDEESIARLTASLRANVIGWNGNTDAIETTIKAAQRLGFEDDDLRNSLALLIGSTGDVAKAQAIQNTAMDLARFKNIDLKTATEALTKVEAGSYRILKGLGIELKEGATQTEALAAVQKVAAGAAEALANTNRGKLTASQIKVNEAMEKLGYAVMPAVVDATVAAADAITQLVDEAGKLDKALEPIGGTGGVLDALAFGLKNMSIAGAQTNAFQWADEWVHGSGAAKNAIDESTRDMAGKMAGLAQAAQDSLGPDGVAGSEDDVGDEADRMRRRAMKAAKDMADSFEKAREDMAGAAKGMIDEFFDPIEIRSDLFDTKRQTAADLESLRTAKTKNEMREAKYAIVQDLDDQAAALVELGGKGKLTQKDVLEFKKRTAAAYKALGEQVPKDIQKIFDKLSELASLKGSSVKVTLTGHVAGHGPLEFATGGVVPGAKGKPRLAIVHGGETVIPNGGGPNRYGGDASGSINVTVVVNPAAGMSPGQGRAFGEAAGPGLVAWMQRNGYLSRTGTGLTG